MGAVFRRILYFCLSDGSGLHVLKQGIHCIDKYLIRTVRTEENFKISVCDTTGTKKFCPKNLRKNLFGKSSSWSENERSRPSGLHMLEQNNHCMEKFEIRTVRNRNNFLVFVCHDKKPTGWSGY